MNPYIKLLLVSVFIAVTLVILGFGGLTLYSLFTFQSIELGQFYQLQVEQDPASFSLELSPGILYIIGITALVILIMSSLGLIIRNANQQSG